MLKSVLFASVFMSFTVTANTPTLVKDVVQLQGPYNVSMDELKSSIVHLWVPDNGVAFVALEGADKFDAFQKNTSALSGDIHETGKVVTIKSSVNDGDLSSVGLTTKCGKSISIVIHGIKNDGIKPDQIKPRLFINSANC